MHLDATTLAELAQAINMTEEDLNMGNVQENNFGKLLYFLFYLIHVRVGIILKLLYHCVYTALLEKVRGVPLNKGFMLR